MSIMDDITSLFSGKKNTLPEISSAAEQTSDEIALCSFVKEKVTEVRQSGSRVAHEGLWMTNTAYLLGFDSVFYDTNTRQFQAIANPTLRRDRIHVNKILPACRRRQAKLCKNPPRYEVKPDDKTEEAKEKARLELQVLDAIWDRERINEKRLIMALGIQTCGHFFMGVYWDTEKGELLAANIESIDEDGKPCIKTEYEYEGQTCVDVISPFEMFVDPLAKTLDEAQWVVRARIRKLDYFKARWPQRGHLIREEDAWLLSVQYEARIQSLTGMGNSSSGTQMQTKNSAIELAYYEKRSRRHPNGRMLIMANGILLEDGELPIGEIPFVKFDDFPIAGKFYSEAVITHARPVQDQFNRLITKRAEWTNRLLAGKYMAARGSDLDEESPNDQSGEVWYYNNVPNASAPTAVNIPVIPQYAYTEEDRLMAMFYDIFGEGDVSRGILPSASMPAIGMQLLLEIDESIVAPTTEQHEYAFADLGRIALKYEETYVTNDRLLKISDPNAQYITRKYSGVDLKSKHDVMVKRGSLAPTSKAVNRNDIMNMLQAGFFGNPADPQVMQKALQAMEFGDVQDAWRDLSLDLAQIKRTIDQIEEGTIPEVSEFDNHTLHIQQKNRYRKSDKFETLDSVKQAILINNMEEHLKYQTNFLTAAQGQPVNTEKQIQLDNMDSMAEVNSVQQSQGTEVPAEQELGQRLDSRMQGLEPRLQ